MRNGIWKKSLAFVLAMTAVSAAAQRSDESTMTGHLDARAAGGVHGAVDDGVAELEPSGDIRLPDEIHRQEHVDGVQHHRPLEHVFAIDTDDEAVGPDLSCGESNRAPDQTQSDDAHPLKDRRLSRQTPGLQHRQLLSLRHGRR